MPPTPYQSAKQSVKHSWESIKSEPLTVKNVKRHGGPLVKDIAAFAKDAAARLLNKHSEPKKADEVTDISSKHSASMNKAAETENNEETSPLWFHEDHHDDDPNGYSETSQRSAKIQAQKDKWETRRKQWAAKNDRPRNRNNPSAVKFNMMKIAANQPAKPRYHHPDDGEHQAAGANTLPR